ncbi:MAG TPA: PAS domain S-box protein, partial [Mariniflexile sp.]|nr:PAS domain S-box protein [Mariniflexile sp.]
MFKDSKDIFNILFEAVSEGVIVVDNTQKIVATNASAEAMFGYSKEEIVNQQLELLIPQKYHAKHGAYFHGFVKHQESRQMGKGRDLFGARKDGSAFPVEVGLNPLKIDGNSFVMALVIDISIRKQHELQLQELNTKLEKKVSERTQELSNTVEALKMVNLERDAEIKKRIEAQNKTKEAL